MTDRDDLSALCLSFLKPPKWGGGSWTLNPGELADAILAAGWVHWPLHPTVDKLTAALNDERELHRDTRTENIALRRRLVELAASDPAESVGE